MTFKMKMNKWNLMFAARFELNSNKQYILHHTIRSTKWIYEYPRADLFNSKADL